MKIELTAAAPSELDVAVLALGIADSAREGAPPEMEALVPELRALIAQGDVSTAEGEAAALPAPPGVRARRLVVAGLGSDDELDADTLRTAAARAASLTGRLHEGSVAWICDGSLPIPLEQQAVAVVEGAVIGTYDPGVWKGGGGPPSVPDSLVLVSPEGDLVALKRARIAAEWTNRARTLVNAGGNEITPERLAADAASIADAYEDVACEALGPAELAGLGMGGILSVGRGSTLEDRLITLTYAPEGAREDVVLGLVGKAITFDAGGISLKPSAKLWLEKSDMAGGAAVLCGFGAIVESRLPIRTVAVLAAAENMPSGSAIRPGDIITLGDGTTVEITNTDAEGRLALADALTHVRAAPVTHIVDVATLTGTTIEAMGDFYGCVFANDETLRDALCDAGAASGDHVWPWPIHRTFRRHLRSPFADLRNYTPIRQALPIYAAMFLERFVGGLPWAHVDMCGPSYLELTREDYYTCEGGTGFGVRLLVRLAERLAEAGA